VPLAHSTVAVLSVVRTQFCSDGKRKGRRLAEGQIDRHTHTHTHRYASVQTLRRVSSPPDEAARGHSGKVIINQDG
jgi:hypothetical protein